MNVLSLIAYIKAKLQVDCLDFIFPLFCQVLLQEGGRKTRYLIKSLQNKVKGIIKIQWQIQQGFIECHSSQGTVRYIISFAVSGQMAKFQVIIAFDSPIYIFNL